MDELIKLQKIEKEKLKTINEIKDAIKIKRGDLHDWEFTSVHHGWTFWYSCKLCGKRNDEDRKLTKEDKEEKCPFFENDFMPDIYYLEKYLKYKHWRK